MALEARHQSYNSGIDHQRTMERTVFFFNLPRELISLLVTDWLDWKAVARLDSALCRHVHRKEWLSILKNDCVTPDVLCNISATLMDRWFILRHIRTCKFYLDDIDPCNLSDTISWLAYTSSLLSHITVSSFPDKSILACIAQHCVNMKVLKLFDCRIEDSHWKYFYALSGLEELWIPYWFCSECTSESSFSDTY